MRFMFITRSQFPVPPEEIPAMMEGFVAWWERYRDRFEGAGFFVEGNGGGGICKVADEAEFHQMVLEWPFAQYSRNEAYALVDMDTALGQWQALLASVPQGDT
jgi:hypothetical protein